MLVITHPRCASVKFASIIKTAMIQDSFKRKNSAVEVINFGELFEINVAFNFGGLSKIMLENTSWPITTNVSVIRKGLTNVTTISDCIAAIQLENKLFEKNSLSYTTNTANRVDNIVVPVWAESVSVTFKDMADVYDWIMTEYENRLQALIAINNTTTRWVAKIHLSTYAAKSERAALNERLLKFYDRLEKTLPCVILYREDMMGSFLSYCIKNEYLYDSKSFIYDNKNFNKGPTGQVKRNWDTTPLEQLVPNKKVNLTVKQAYHFSLNYINLIRALENYSCKKLKYEDLFGNTDLPVEIETIDGPLEFSINQIESLQLRVEKPIVYAQDKENFFAEPAKIKSAFTFAIYEFQLNEIAKKYNLKII
jgi:hypothetical protein